MRGIEQIPWAYDAGMVLLEHLGLGRFRTELVSRARGLTLDLGCGTGRNLPLLPAGARGVGLDRTLDVLLAARRRAPGAPLVLGSAEALPFRGGAFDTVVSGLVFCSVSDPARGLGECARVLSQRGALRMLEHVRSASPLMARLQDACQPAWTWFTGGCHPNRETVEAVRSAGYEIAEEEHRERGNLRLFTAFPVAAGEDQKKET